MMFRMEGRKARLVRFVVSYEEPIRARRSQETESRTREERCVSADHRDQVEAMLTAKGIPFTTTAIDQTGNEWFDGREFGSYDEAAASLATGEAAYLESQKQTTQARLDAQQSAIEAIIIGALTGGD